MNLAWYLVSVGLTAGVAAVAVWAQPRIFRFPAFTRVAVGVGTTPLWLAVIALLSLAVWPGAPHWFTVGFPALVALLVIAVRPRVSGAVTRLLFRRLRERGLVQQGFLAAASALLVGVAMTAFGNARAPVDAHDALIYLNEARVIADQPRWSTLTALVAPTAVDGLVAGHTHTWLFPAFLAQALRATEAPTIGWGHDFPARVAIQANLVLLVVAVLGLAWLITKRHAVLTLAAGIAVVCIPSLAYVTANSSIDAFRLLPLVLLAIASNARLDRTGTVVAVAALLGLSVAAHTLNAFFAPLVLLVRLAVREPPESGWRVLRRLVPWALLALAPVAAFYAYLYGRTGQVLGHGLHYPFYVGTPLEVVARVGILEDDRPTWTEIWTTLSSRHGWWVVVVPLVAILASGARPLARSARRLRWYVAAVWSLVILATFEGMPQLGARLLLGNVRYSLALWVLAWPLTAAILAAFWGGEWWRWRPLSIRRVPAGGVMAIGVGVAWMVVRAWWPLAHSTEEALRIGEWRIAAEVAQQVGPGERWMSDRNTAAYYVQRPGIFLYTPAGQRWLQAETPEAAWQLLSAHRVRLVALGNLDPEWWPRTALYAALQVPGRAERIQLQRWQIYRVNLPPAEGVAAP